MGGGGVTWVFQTFNKIFTGTINSCKSYKLDNKEYFLSIEYVMYGL